MPQYPYQCQSCYREFDVIKSVIDIDQEEICEQCGNAETKRLIAMSNLEKSSMQQPYYEPALGCIINGKGHKQQILKERGLEEVGTTNPDTMYKDLEQQKAKERARQWDDL